MTLYLISGLGADRRAFQKLSFPQGWKIIHIEWIPVLKNESLQEYCFRLSAQIEEKNDFSIIGLSFGGIIAIELSRIVKPQKLVLISSVMTSNEIPRLFRIAGFLSLHKLVPGNLLMRVNFLRNYFFGLKTKEEKDLLTDIIRNTDKNFLTWAIDKLVSWDNDIRPKNIFHLHGYKDKLLPVSNVKADYIVSGGGHLMVFSDHAEISKILIEHLK